MFYIIVYTIIQFAYYTFVYKPYVYGIENNQKLN
jgi:hypothetical protein